MEGGGGGREVGGGGGREDGGSGAGGRDEEVLGAEGLSLAVTDVLLLLLAVLEGGSS